MATRSPVQIPLFTQREIWVAECCALALWNGISFETLKHLVPSDEVLLANFDLGFQYAVRSHQGKSLLTPQMVMELISVAKTTQTYRGKYPLDIQLGIKGIENVATTSYAAAVSPKARNTRFQAGLNALNACSTQWSTGLPLNPTPNQVPKRTYRVVLTTRVLFFCVPEMEIYNFRNAFKEKLKLPTQSHVAIQIFNRLMSDGLDRNKALLSKLTLPKSKIIKKRAWNRINKSDWWQRRVIDIALLIHLAMATAHPLIQQQVMRRIRRGKRNPHVEASNVDQCCLSAIMRTKAGSEI